MLKWRVVDWGWRMGLGAVNKDRGGGQENNKEKEERRLTRGCEMDHLAWPSIQFGRNGSGLCRLSLFRMGEYLR